MLIIVISAHKLWTHEWGKHGHLILSWSRSRQEIPEDESLELLRGLRSSPHWMILVLPIHRIDEFWKACLISLYPWDISVVAYTSALFPSPPASSGDVELRRCGRWNLVWLLGITPRLSRWLRTHRVWGLERPPWNAVDCLTRRDHLCTNCTVQSWRLIFEAGAVLQYRVESGPRSIGVPR